MTETVQSKHSSALEKVLEHLFVGELLRCLWKQGRRDVEVLRSEVDSSGYDLVVESNGVIRHIQLKSSHRKAKTAEVKINIGLSKKPSGCVVWMFYDPESLELRPLLWFGGKPGQSLPVLGDKIARHTKGDKTGKKAERPNIRVLAKSRFTPLKTIGEVADALFGAN